MTTNRKLDTDVELAWRTGRPAGVTGPRIRKTLLTWLAITVVGLLTGVLVIGTLPSDMDPAQSAESKRTEVEIQRLTGVSSQIVIAVPSRSDEGDAAKIETLRARYAALPGVESVTTNATVHPQATPAFRSIDGRNTAIVVAISTEANDDQIDRIIAETRRASTDMFGPAVRIAGSAVVDEALGATAERDLLRADAIAVPIVLALLALVLRTRRALWWGLASIIATIGGSLLLLGAVSQITDVSVFAVNVVTMFAIGLTVDYTLLIATEFHRQLAEHANEPDPVTVAVSAALATAGRTVIYSGLTVGAALAGLLLFREPVLRSLGIGGIGATLTAVTVANTLLPALLRRSKPKTRYTETDASNPFRRLARVVTARPVLAIAGSLALLAILAAPALRLTSAGLDVRALPPQHPTRQAVESVTSAFPALTLATTEILVEAPADDPATNKFVQRLRMHPGIAAVESTSVARSETLVVVRAAAELHRDLVESIRNERRALRFGVTGETAEDIDFTNSLLGRLPFAFAVMAGFTVLLLWLLTSSVLIPLKAVIVSLGSLAASTGVLVWAFQDGHLASILGFSRVGGLDPVIVVLAAIFAFGLSTDYEVFLLSAIERERRNGAATNLAIEHGVGRTGRIITLAAALIIVVFIGFATGELIIIKQLGVALAAAILIDATIVRLVLVPATLALFAERNWWQPEPLRRLHNRIVGAIPGLRHE